MSITQFAFTNIGCHQPTITSNFFINIRKRFLARINSNASIRQQLVQHFRLFLTQYVTDSSEISSKCIKCVKVPLCLQDSDLIKQSSVAGAILFVKMRITSFADFEVVMKCLDYWPTSVFHYIVFHFSEVKSWCEQTGCGIGQLLKFVRKCWLQLRRKFLMHRL